MSYAGRMQDAMHDVLEGVMPDGAVVDWKMRSQVTEAFLRALPIFEAEVRQQGVRRAFHALSEMVERELRS